jgi:dephospho-CoA kinase
MPRPARIAVTGGIGSGKSTVVAMLAERGAAVIDSDAIAHELTAAGGQAIGPIRAAFGAAVIDAQGALDRARMRALVFSDPAQRARLEAILHPLIRQRSLELAQRREAEAPLLIFDIPLLVEAASVRRTLGLDRILVVDCPAAVQLARARARGTMPEEELRKVMASQAPRWQRLEIADDVLVNAGSLEALRARVARLWRSYCPGEPV